MRNIFGSVLYLCIFIILSGCVDPHDKAEVGSLDVLEDFIHELNHGDLIIDSEDPEEVIAAVDEQLGEYFSGNFSRKVAYQIRNSMEGNPNYEETPENITFFLTNTGDGFLYSQIEASRRDGVSSWLTQDDKIVGTEIRITLPSDIPEQDSKYELYDNITMMKIDNKWYIDDIEYFDERYVQ
ncbi:hypothetical protein ACFQ4Z_05735 [Oceanobacillus oncorhynchi subsp. oncorhynchi]|uniref:hypothetical protein n=1 Tax=Oceanobacillus oncorhynchi TaxID=545501 RepID=UPI00363AA83C